MNSLRRIADEWRVRRSETPQGVVHSALRVPSDWGRASRRAFGREPERRRAVRANGVVGSRPEQAGGGVRSGAEGSAAGSAQACGRRSQRRRCKRATDGNAVVPKPVRASEGHRPREEDASPLRKLAGELSGYPAYAGELAKRQRNTSRRQDRPRTEDQIVAAYRARRSRRCVRSHGGAVSSQDDQRSL